MWLLGDSKGVSSYLWSFVPAALTFSSRGGAEALSGTLRAQPWDNSRAARISGEEIATLAKMLCESSGSAVARIHKTCLAALNSAGNKIIT